MKRSSFLMPLFFAMAQIGCVAQSTVSEPGNSNGVEGMAEEGDIAWAGYDASRHSVGWATMREDGGIVQDIDSQTMPIIGGKQGIIVTRPGEEGYKNLLDAIGELKPGERKRIRGGAGQYDVTEDRKIIYHRIISPHMVAESYLIHDGITASDPRYECYSKYLSYRKPGKNYVLYRHQLEMIGKCLAPAGLKP